MSFSLPSLAEHAYLILGSTLFCDGYHLLSLKSAASIHFLFRRPDSPSSFTLQVLSSFSESSAAASTSSSLWLHVLSFASTPLPANRAGAGSRTGKGKGAATGALTIRSHHFFSLSPSPLLTHLHQSSTSVGACFPILLSRYIAFMFLNTHSHDHSHSLPSSCTSYRSPLPCIKQFPPTHPVTPLLAHLL
jgi:hypothetical protein